MWEISALGNIRIKSEFELSLHGLVFSSAFLYKDDLIICTTGLNQGYIEIFKIKTGHLVYKKRYRGQTPIFAGAYNDQLIVGFQDYNDKSLPLEFLPYSEARFRRIRLF